MREIKTVSGGPIQAEFVVMMSGGNVGMAAGPDIGIDAHGNRRRSATRGNLPRGFTRESFELSFRFDIEEKDSAVLRAAPAHSGIAQGFADFLAGLPYPGKNNSAAVHSDAPQTVEFAAGNNVEAAAEPREEPENCEISAG